MDSRAPWKRRGPLLWSTWPRRSRLHPNRPHRQRVPPPLPSAPPEVPALRRPLPSGHHWRAVRFIRPSAVSARDRLRRSRPHRRRLHPHRRRRLPLRHSRKLKRRLPRSSHPAGRFRPRPSLCPAALRRNLAKCSQGRASHSRQRPSKDCVRPRALLQIFSARQRCPAARKRPNSPGRQRLPVRRHSPARVRWQASRPRGPSFLRGPISR